MQDLLNLLQSFEEGTVTMSEDQYVTIPKIIPIIHDNEIKIYKLLILILNF